MATEAEKRIDMQFNRAVEIVQSLPKTGPIQTGYEEKLAMYSLYKQATVGPVKGTRPPMWDMLGRAKWDAWAKHKGLSEPEAKWRYVDELLRVLKKYSDKTVAQDLVRELESYRVDPSAIMMSGSYSADRESDSSSSSRSSSPPPGHQRLLSQSIQQRQEEEDADSQSEEDEDGDRLGTGMHGLPQLSTQSQMLNRPQSSHSTQRYRTPMGGSVMMSPPPAGMSGISASVAVHPLEQSYQQLLQNYVHPSMQSSSIYVQPQSVQHAYGGSGPLSAQSQGIPNTQPLPNYEMSSAFPGPSPPASSPGISTHPAPPHSSSLSASGASSYANVAHPYPTGSYAGHPAYRMGHTHSQSQDLGLTSGISGITGLTLTSSGVRSPLERAVVNVQAHLSALQERIDRLEGTAGGGTPYDSHMAFGAGPLQRSRSSPRSSPYASYSGSYGLGPGGRDAEGLLAWLSSFNAEYFDWEHMGLWSVVLAPLARMTKLLARIVAFLITRRSSDGAGRGLSPGLVVLRRLLLDVSFVLCALALGRKLWRRSGVRRKEVLAALKGVWGAVVGSGGAVTRQFVDRGV